MRSNQKGEKMTPDLLDFSDRVAIVTGGGTGIGAATAMLFARLGADVVIAGRRAEVLDRAAAEIVAATGRRCVGIPTDVCDEAQVAAMVQGALDQFGRIDILVNNAGATVLKPLADVTTDIWRGSFALNVDSAYYCTRETGRHMRERGTGTIVNVSSMAGVNGVKNGVPYSAAKSALQMMTRVLAMEWGPHGIRVNCVAPGLILGENVMANLLASGLDIEAMAKVFPLRRAGRPDDIANAIVWFASDAAGYVTGETLAVCGGPVQAGTEED
jgi:NAD(P)-dependent dehydrogenase (short-subunit alcohol dehydrogenase family)